MGDAGVSALAAGCVGLSAVHAFGCTRLGEEGALALARGCAALHCDANNAGPSLIIGLGAYKGGELWVWGAIGPSGALGLGEKDGNKVKNARTPVLSSILDKAWPAHLAFQEQCFAASAHYQISKAEFAKGDAIGQGYGAHIESGVRSALESPNYPEPTGSPTTRGKAHITAHTRGGSSNPSSRAHARASAGSSLAQPPLALVPGLGLGVNVLLLACASLRVGCSTNASFWTSVMTSHRRLRRFDIPCGRTDSTR